MKKKHLFTITSLLCFLPFFLLKGQTEERILYPDTKWSVLRSNIFDDNILPNNNITWYAVNGDTLINSIAYYKIYKNDTELYACLREENMKLFGVFPFLELQEEKLLYNFNSWQIGGFHQSDVIENYIETLIIKIEKLDTIRLDDGKQYQMINESIIRTVGSLSGIFEALHPWPSDGSYWKLVSYYRDGIQIYSQDKNYLSLGNVKTEYKPVVYIDENGQLVFDFKNDRSMFVEKIVVYSAEGTIRLTFNAESGNSHLASNLQKGVYFYRIIYSDTNKNDCGKFFIK